MGGPLGARDMSIFVKHMLSAALGYIHSWKQRRQLYQTVFSKYEKERLQFPLCAHSDILILWFYDTMILGLSNTIIR